MDLSESPLNHSIQEMNKKRYAKFIAFDDFFIFCIEISHDKLKQTPLIKFFERWRQKIYQFVNRK